jgi:cephalosporin hydroxylase
MSEKAKFEQEVRDNVDAIGKDDELRRDTLQWMIRAGGDYRYSYNFSWMGRPIIQYPQDIVGMQELIWRVRPDLIVEMGIAHGGSLICNASMLALLEYSEAVEAGTVLDPAKPQRKVLGVDIDIRQHNRAAIEAHPMAGRIEMIEGSSVDAGTIAQVREFAASYNNVMVVLDSNHTHEHVLAELEAYGDLTAVGSYCIVFDTVVEDVPEEYSTDRPWGKGDNPKTAVWEYLKSHPEFEIDKDIENKLLITVAPDGFLRRVS